MKSQNWMFLTSLILVVFVMLGTGGSSLFGQGAASSDLIDVILDNWSHNTVRPSNAGR